MKRLRFLLILIFLDPNLALAAAYTPPLHEGQLFLSFLHYNTRRNFNDNRTSKNFENSGKFNKNEISFYTLYRFKPQWAVVATGSIYNQLEYKDRSSSQKFNGMGDSGVGLRYLIEQNSEGSQALQAMFFFPLYTQNANPTPGNHQYDYELRYLRDYYQVLNLDFISWEVAFRHRTSAPSDQIRAEFNLGKSYKDFLFIMKSAFIQGLRNNSSVIGSSNPNASNDFDLLKIGPAAVWKFSQKNALEIGYMNDVWGRNTGNGQTIYSSYWRDFEL